MSQTAILFANGDLLDFPALGARIQPDDLLIAVDGGLRHVATMGRIPDILIGDMDSIEPVDVASCRLAGSEVIRFPVEKDQTDLELAIDLALERGYTTLIIAGALGGRLDHALGNLSLLSRPDLAGLDVRLDDGEQEVLLVMDTVVLEGQPGDIVSLIPFTRQVRGVRTDGLQYPLNGETLRRYQTRGISNVMLSLSGQIHVQTGSLLVVHTRQHVERNGDK